MAHFITQQESDFLFQMEKFPESNESYSFPVSGTKIVIPFTSSLLILLKILLYFVNNRCYNLQE